MERLRKTCFFLALLSQSSLFSASLYLSYTHPSVTIMDPEPDGRSTTALVEESSRFFGGEDGAQELTMNLRTNSPNGFEVLVSHLMMDDGKHVEGVFEGLDVELYSEDGDKKNKKEAKGKATLLGFNGGGRGNKSLRVRVRNKNRSPVAPPSVVLLMVRAK